MDELALKDYIAKAKAKGLDDNSIKILLMQNGWSESVVNSALNIATIEDLTPPKPSHLQTRQNISVTKPSSSMWDAFEHCLLFISLYIMATSIDLILNYFVDKWLPGITDINNYSADTTWQDSLLRGYLAALIVSLPLFIFFFLRITKETLQTPAIRNLGARKILIYLTLVITFIIMLWNVITIVFTFLSGNVTLNFLLHFIITVLVSGIVFGYYLFQVKEDRKLHA